MDQDNNRIAIVDRFQEALKTVQDLSGGVLLGRSIPISPPKDWTANIMPIAETTETREVDTGGRGGYDDMPSTMVALELNVFTLQVEFGRAQLSLREAMRVEAAILRAIYSVGWTDLCLTIEKEGTIWSYPEPGTSTGQTFCAIQFTFQWFSAPGDLVHQPA